MHLQAICYLCGENVEPTAHRPMRWDHVVPLSRGGPDIPANLRPCCRQCNRLKAAWMLEEFRERCLAVLYDLPDRRFTAVHRSRIWLYERIVEHMGWDPEPQPVVPVQLELPVVVP